jgi:hypothetical protein
VRGIPLLVALSACGAAYTTEKGEIGLAADGLAVAPFARFEGGPVLAGHDVCFTCGTIRVGGDLGGETRTACEGPPGSSDKVAYAACYDVAVTGAAREGACFRADGPGTATLTFTPRPCGLPEPPTPRAPDTTTLTWVDGVTAALDLPMARYAATLLDRPGGVRVAGGLPQGWLPEPGEPLRVVAGGRADLGVVLRDPAGALVAVRADRAPLSVSTTRGKPPKALVDCEDRIVRLTPSAGGQASVGVVVDGAPHVAGEVIAVRPGEAASLDLVVVRAITDTELEVPLAVRALVRDRKGRVLHGAPITWTTTGDRVHRWPVGSSVGASDWLGFDDRCLEPEADPDGDLHVTATLGRLSASVDLAWARESGPMGGQGCDDAREAESPFVPLEAAACAAGAAPR